MLLVRPRTMAPEEDVARLEHIDRLDRHIQAWTGNAAQVIDVSPTTLRQATALLAEADRL